MKKELKKRIITSAVMVAILLNCLFINNLSWLFLLTIVSLICWFEFIYLVKKIWKKDIIKILPIVLSFFFLCLFLYSAYIPKIHGGESLILFILGVCIFSDIGGYVVGKSVGGKKLTKISPNKTISGSIGSFLFSLIPVGLIIFNEHNILDLNNHKQILIFYSLIISLSCQLGDLVISYFKRMAKVKDTGNILPGHGGMLDRIDGIIFAIPTSFIISYLL